MKPLPVVVVGGGMVGAALACALGKAGMDVVLIETATTEPGSVRRIEDPRVSALTRASERILQQLGVWQHIATENLGSFREMHVWEQQQAGAIHFDCAELGQSHLGHIVENNSLLQALWAQLKSYKSVQILRPEQVKGLQTNAQQVAVQLRDSELQTYLLVAADGGQSNIRHLTNWPVRRRDYGQKALVATVQTSFDHRQTAWQRFLPNGPLAFLPLGNGRCSIVWSNTPESAESLQTIPEIDFLVALEEASEGVLGTMEAVGPRALFPLRRQYAPHYVRPHLALVGDAAHIIHPLAGQGVNLGFLDIGVLAEVIQQAWQRGRNPGLYGNLRRYERWRKGQNLAMMRMMDAFHLLFTHHPPALGALRRTGLRCANRIQPLKRLIMHQAAGLGGDLPPLANP